MKKLLLVLLLFCTFSSVKAQTFNSQLATMLQDTLNYYVAAITNIKGMSASVYVPGQGIWKGTAGVSYTGQPITSDMRFGIASNTKLFVSTIMLKLAENGIISLDDSVKKWLPTYQNVNPNIKIRQLLNHTSGVSDPIFTSPWMDTIMANPTRVFPPTEVLTWLGAPLFSVGTSYGYSNVNYILAGMIAKNATGFHVSRLIRDSILAPLNMDSTFYDVEETAVGTISHRWWNNVDYHTTSRVGLNTAGGCAGAMFSTAAEMSQWYRALFSGQILNQSSLNELKNFLNTQSPTYQYSLGLSREKTQGLTYWGHGGSTWGYRSKMIYDSCRQVAVCGLTNSFPSGMESVTFLLYRAVVNHIPACSGPITGAANVCQGQNAVTYNVPAIANATSYTWTLPTGTTGTSTTNSITVNFGVTATSGVITVKGNNTYGSGASSAIAITVNPLPTAAGTISGNSTVCQGQDSVLYVVPIINNATSYMWTLPSGATGAINNDTIIVSYSAAASSENISVKGNNACGNGTSSTLSVTVNPLPSATGTISGDATVCQGQDSVMYIVPTINNATSYVWTLPSGATGAINNDTIKVNFSATASSGNISVKGNNACGDGTTSTISITVNPLPDAAGTISGDATVCQGQDSVLYIVPTINNATSYVWTLPSGATTGAINNDTIKVNFSAMASSGSIAVKGNNACGDGTTSTISITVNPLPDAAGTISGNTTVCQTQDSVIYTLPNVNNATSYVWSLPSGATGAINNDTIKVNFSATASSGNITVKGNNTCGNGTSATLAVTVNPKPVTPTISLIGNVLQSDATNGNQWYNSAGVISGATNSFYTAPITDNYYNIVTLMGCNSNQSNSIHVTVAGVGIATQPNQLGLSVYPNPASELINIYTFYSSERMLNFYTALGSLVRTEKMNASPQQINISSLPIGIYLIEIISTNGTERQKLIIRR
ncbi:MAG: serine hydrolase [Bacteroidia bacterium]|nr:serine hydrolase [Bacteroidia bacterium]MBP7260634.1 serine hydrolase [Bacteroidia bacterium]MBP9180016.1 serine hydrolase [Bacteroidia bacterium]MBP9723543.1 serine hydrolase [Bacteroidia bacterium]